MRSPTPTYQTGLPGNDDSPSRRRIGTSPTSLGPTEALPVRLLLAGAHSVAVGRWVESVVGWQAVEPAASRLVPPVLTLADVAGVSAAPVELPLVLLVADEDEPRAAAAAATRATAVVGWPADRSDLVEVAAAISAAAPNQRETLELRIGGAAGGVGTTTVALALGGLVAWRGQPTLVLTHGAVPCPGGRAVSHEELSGVPLWDLAAPSPGVAALRVLRLAAPVAHQGVEAAPATMVVRDLGVDEAGDVLVIRRDRPGLEALARSAAAAAVVTDTGPAPLRSLEQAAGGRRFVRLPWSVRVAHAAFTGRIPAGLPGSWLRALAPVLADARR
ncbi:MAG: hypothetical protein ABR592_04910 [Nitriliruptorales bacterium]